MSTGTARRKTVPGSASSREAPHRPPSTGRAPEADGPAPLAPELAAVGRDTAERAGDQPNCVADVGEDRRVADSQQGRERDERAGADNDVHGAGDEPAAATATAAAGVTRPACYQTLGQPIAGTWAETIAVVSYLGGADAPRSAQAAQAEMFSRFAARGEALEPGSGREPREDLLRLAEGDAGLVGPGSGDQPLAVLEQA